MFYLLSSLDRVAMEEMSKKGCKGPSREILPRTRVCHSDVWYDHSGSSVSPLLYIFSSSTQIRACLRVNLLGQFDEVGQLHRE